WGMPGLACEKRREGPQGPTRQRNQQSVSSAPAPSLTSSQASSIALPVSVAALSMLSPAFSAGPSVSQALRPTVKIAAARSVMNLVITLEISMLVYSISIIDYNVRTLHRHYERTESGVSPG